MLTLVAELMSTLLEEQNLVPLGDAPRTARVAGDTASISRRSAAVLTGLRYAHLSMGVPVNERT